MSTRKRKKGGPALVLPEIPDPVVTVTERERRKPANGELDLLEQLGTRACPDGLKYLGSAAIHFYQNGIDQSDQTMLCQLKLIVGPESSVPEPLAVEGSKELGRQLMQAYGHKPPAKRGDVVETDS